MAPLRILLLGKNPAMQKAVIEGVKPEYEVVHEAYSVEAAVELLPSLVGGSEKQIDLVIMGGGFSPADFQKVQEVSGAKDVPWLRPDMPKRDPSAGPPQPPPADVIAKRVKKTLTEHQDEVQQGSAAGQVWMF